MRSYGSGDLLPAIAGLADDPHDEGGAEDRRDDPRRVRMAEDDAADDAGDERAAQAGEHRADAAHRLPTRDRESPERADDQTTDGQSDDESHAGSVPPPPTHFVEKEERDDRSPTGDRR